MRGIYVFHDYRLPLPDHEACHHHDHLYRDLWKEAFDANKQTKQ